MDYDELIIFGKTDKHETFGGLKRLIYWVKSSLQLYKNMFKPYLILCKKRVKIRFDLKHLS